MGRRLLSRSAEDAVRAYFDALTRGDADAVIRLMASVPYYVKIGTDDGEFHRGAEFIDGYFRDVAANAADLSIHTSSLSVEERETVVWFAAEQVWRLKWKGAPETLAMRVTGVLERLDGEWRFVQIHASVGAQDG